jgi:hypothetical protein
MMSEEESTMMIFTDQPDPLETELEQRVRKVRKRVRPVAEVSSRQAADAVRWGHPR